MTAVKAISSEPTQGLLLHHTHGSAPHSQKCSSTPARKLAAMIFVGALGPAECRGSWLCSARKRLIAACSSTARRKKLVAIGRSISRHFQDVSLIWEMFGG